MKKGEKRNDRRLHNIWFIAIASTNYDIRTITTIKNLPQGRIIQMTHQEALDNIMYDETIFTYEYGEDEIGYTKGIIKDSEWLKESFDTLQKLINDYDHLVETNKELHKQLGEMNSEICNRCGNYLYEKNRCDSCRWR